VIGMNIGVSRSTTQSTEPGREVRRELIARMLSEHATDHDLMPAALATPRWRGFHDPAFHRVDVDRSTSTPVSNMMRAREPIRRPFAPSRRRRAGGRFSRPIFVRGVGSMR